MQGPTIKTYFAKQRGIDPVKIVNVAVTPCTAKKFEIRREEMRDYAGYNSNEGLRDMDHVITTRELARWMREGGLEPVSYTHLDGYKRQVLTSQEIGKSFVSGAR